MQLSGNPEVFPLSAVEPPKQYNSFPTGLARGVFTVGTVFKQTDLSRGRRPTWLPGQRSCLESSRAGMLLEEPRPRGTRSSAAVRGRQPGFSFLGVQESINPAFFFCSRLSNGTDVLCVSEESLNKNIGSLALSKLNFDSTYTVVVAASNGLGSAFSQPLVFMLIDIGKCVTYCVSVSPGPLERGENILSTFFFKPLRTSIHPA